LEKTRKYYYAFIALSVSLFVVYVILVSSEIFEHSNREHLAASSYATPSPNFMSEIDINNSGDIISFTRIRDDNVYFYFLNSGELVTYPPAFRYRPNSSLRLGGLSFSPFSDDVIITYDSSLGSVSAVGIINPVSGTQQTFNRPFEAISNAVFYRARGIAYFRQGSDLGLMQENTSGFLDYDPSDHSSLVTGRLTFFDLDTGEEIGALAHSGDVSDEQTGIFEVLWGAPGNIFPVNEHVFYATSYQLVDACASDLERERWRAMYRSAQYSSFRIEIAADSTDVDCPYHIELNDLIGARLHVTSEGSIITYLSREYFEQGEVNHSLSENETEFHRLLMGDQGIDTSPYFLKGLSLNYVVYAGRSTDHVQYFYLCELSSNTCDMIELN